MPKGKSIKQHKPTIRDLKYPEEGQEIACVLKAKGNCQFELQRLTGDKIISTGLKGALKRGGPNNRINENDWVLIEKMNGNPPFAYMVIHKYNKQDENTLKDQGHFNKIEQEDDEEEDNIVFGDPSGATAGEKNQEELEGKQ